MHECTACNQTKLCCSHPGENEIMMMFFKTSAPWDLEFSGSELGQRIARRRDGRRFRSETEGNGMYFTCKTMYDSAGFWRKTNAKGKQLQRYVCEALWHFVCCFFFLLLLFFSSSFLCNISTGCFFVCVCSRVCVCDTLKGRLQKSENKQKPLRCHFISFLPPPPLMRMASLKY